MTQEDLAPPLAGTGRKWVAPALAGLTLACVLVIAGLVHLQYGESRDRQLRAAVERFERSVDSQLVVLAAIKGMMIAHRGPVTSSELARFLDGLPASAGASAALGYGFALATPPDRPEIARAAAARSLPEAPAPWPATDQPIRFPIIVLAPQDEANRQAIGYDMYSEAVRRDAMRRAAGKRGFAATAPVRLVQQQGDASGYGALIYLPVFRGEGVASPTPPESIASDVVGFVYAPLRVGDLVNKVLAESRGQSIAMSATDISDGAEAPLWTAAHAVGRAISREIAVADRRWRIEAREAREPAAYTNPALAILLLGGGMGMLFVLLGRAHLRSIVVADRLAAETRARAELAEVMLGEMRHRIKNSIARKLALFRLSAREAADKESLAQLFEARLQALARAQDLLLAPPESGLTIRRLLDDEVAEWRAGPAAIRIDGPDLRLDGAQLQALALIFHELTTNSLKYGALVAGGALDVVWRVAPAEKGDQVALEWRERGLAQAAGKEPAAAAAGYGSRLIRLMAEGELGGAVERRLGAAELTLMLRFPLRTPRSAA